MFGCAMVRVRGGHLFLFLSFLCGSAEMDLVVPVLDVHRGNISIMGVCVEP
jgi:hypothetical protein